MFRPRGSNSEVPLGPPPLERETSGEEMNHTIGAGKDTQSAELLMSSWALCGKWTSLFFRCFVVSRLFCQCGGLHTGTFLLCEALLLLAKSSLICWSVLLVALQSMYQL